MFVDTLVALFLFLSGGLAGVLVAVEIAVVPMFADLPGERYVQVHRLLDPRFDPLMPNANKVALGIGVLLMIFAHGIGAKLSFGIAEVGIIGVALVSELSNVRINRRMDTWDLEQLPEGWSGVRARWARSNRDRTLIALFGFAAAIAGTILIWD
jgi:hypothetical protein